MNATFRILARFLVTRQDMKESKQANESKRILFTDIWSFQPYL